MTELHIALIYFAFINLLGAIVNIVDKVKAKLDKYRIPEKVLWSIGIAGGAVGSYVTMQIIRHKTRKKTFAIIFPILSIIQVALLVYFVSQYYAN
jgi:uncharacterized membrane protein YsdA (DUF1294 family)